MMSIESRNATEGFPLQLKTACKCWKKSCFVCTWNMTLSRKWDTDTDGDDGMVTNIKLNGIRCHTDCLIIDLTLLNCSSSDGVIAVLYRSARSCFRLSTSIWVSGSTPPSSSPTLQSSFSSTLVRIEVASISRRSCLSRRRLHICGVITHMCGMDREWYDVNTHNYGMNTHKCGMNT